MARRVLKSLGVCFAAALLETLCAGTAVQQRFDELQFPAYSLPLWSWFVVGGLYYAMCFSVLYRIFLHESGAPCRLAAFSLVIALMVTNGLWNLAFFRFNQLLLAFAFIFPYVLIALALFVVLRRLDRTASWLVVPYLAYLLYAAAWGHGVWRLNGSF